MSLSDLVLSIADNKQMLGLRYAEWATRAPSLEADIAAAAMGLDDLGHSRVLYGCLEPLGEDPRGPDRETDAGSLRSLPYFDEPWTEWGQFVAANSILDTAFTTMIEACVSGSVEVLRHRLRKMLMEERYHFLHGRSWLRSGIDAQPLTRAWQEAIEWFGPPDGETAQLHEDGRLSMGPKELFAACRLRATKREFINASIAAQTYSWWGISLNQALVGLHSGSRSMKPMSAITRMRLLG